MSSRGITRALLAAGAIVVLAAAVFLLTRPHGSGTAGEAAGDSAQQARYHCPMHPTVVSDKPGDCPICGMRMVPIEEPLSAEGAAVEGRAAVELSEEKRQLIGVRSAPVERKPLIRTIHAVARVTYDETRLHHVHTKIGGWVETLYANATGERVKQGDPLLTIYSPELLASGQEYLLALRARERLAGTTLPSIRASGEDLVESARRRLLLFDLTPDQIAAIERTGEVPRTMTLYAPITGHIIARNVTQGEKIESGTNLLDIADLSRVWVIADVYEYELPFVHEGQSATMTLSYLPGRTFEGRITLIYPALSEATRTAKVRLELPNAGFALKPEMYVEAEIRSDLGEKLVVPEGAVISTGERDIAFVDRGEGRFEPRELRLGARLPESFEVLSGLVEGEKVVVSGNFLVDSESRMKAALGAVATSTPAADAGSAAREHRH